MADCACNNFPASLGNVTFGASVGIGTVSPAKRLHASDTAEGLLRLERTGAIARRWDINIRPNFMIGDDTAGADRLTIDTNGNVGIGTAGPGAKLDVAGDLLISATSGETPHHTGLQRVGGDTILWYGGGTGNLQIKTGQGGQPGDRVTITPAGDLLLKGALAQLHGRSLVGLAANTNNDLLNNVGPTGNVYWDKGNQGGGAQAGGTQIMRLRDDGALLLGTTPRVVIDTGGYAVYG